MSGGMATIGTMLLSLYVWRSGNCRDDVAQLICLEEWQLYSYDVAHAVNMSIEPATKVTMLLN